jgi:hypothetical protein
MPRWPNFDKLFAAIEASGYIVLSGPYKEQPGWKNPYYLMVQCPEKHPAYRVDTRNFLFGKRRCKFCGRKASADKRRQSLKEISDILKADGYELLETEFRNSHQRLRVKCPVGHDWTVNIMSFKDGIRCWACSSQAPFTVDEVKEKLAVRGYTLLSGYVNSYTNIEVRCPNGHVRPMLYTNFQMGYGCGGCPNRSSKKEIELREFVRGHYPEVSDGPVTGLLPNKRFELDIWVPSLRKAIEFDGEYYHALPENRRRDLLKDSECREVGIHLLRVQSLDYIKNTETVQQRVLDFLRDTMA